MYLPILILSSGSSVPELTACAVDISAHFSSYSNIYSAFFKFILEIHNILVFRTPDHEIIHHIFGFFVNRIDRDEIDMCVLAGQQSDQVRHVLIGVVEPPISAYS